MSELYQGAQRAAAGEIDVLIQGETGSGKELVSRTIHCHSSRASGPFIAVNCAAVAETLFESEFFGAERGSFTGAEESRPGRFEQAKGGTLFLDEISEIGWSTQAKFLRALQERVIRRVGGRHGIPLDVQVISATNVDLERWLEEKRFRYDLYYRLAGDMLNVPALRERPEDIPLLAKHFLEIHAAKHGLNVPVIEAEAIDLLQRETWPGNVRQLENHIRRAMLQAKGDSIGAAAIQKVLSKERTSVLSLTLGEYIGQTLRKVDQGELDKALEHMRKELEREAVAEALKRTNGNRTEAAQLLGISRHSLQRMLRKREADRGRG